VAGAGDGADGAAGGGGQGRPGNDGGREGVREPGAGGDQAALTGAARGEEAGRWRKRHRGPKVTRIGSNPDILNQPLLG
jgi:hypothetical protein